MSPSVAGSCSVRARDEENEGDTAVATIGSHCVLDMYDCPAGLLDDLDLITAALANAASVAKSTLLSQTAHRFEPHGVTAIALLAESHISVHTWPELGYAAADIFTCGEHCLPEAACRSLAKALSAGRFELHQMERGSPTVGLRPARLPAVGPAATSDTESDKASAG